MYVLDASFIASLILPDEASEKAAALAEELVHEGTVAPGLLQLEVTNILLVAQRRKRIDAVQLRMLSEAFDKFPVKMQPLLTPGQRAEVMRLAQKHQLSAYDAAYLELAVRLNLPLASLDEPLRKAAKAEGIKLAIRNL